MWLLGGTSSLLPFPLAKLPEVGSVQQIARWLPAMVVTPCRLRWVAHPEDFGCPAERSPPRSTGTRHSRGPSPSLLAAAHPSAIVWAPFLPVAGLAVGSPDDLCFFTIQDFLCPQETLDCHCANHSIMGNGSCYRLGEGRGIFTLFSLPWLLCRIQSTNRGLLLSGPQPSPSILPMGILSSLTCLFPTPGLPALPLPPQRPLQELEGTGFNSLSCLALGTPRQSVPWAFLRWTHLLPQMAVGPSVYGGGSQTGLGGSGGSRFCSHSGDSKQSILPKHAALGSDHGY